MGGSVARRIGQWRAARRYEQRYEQPFAEAGPVASCPRRQPSLGSSGFTC
jgi:hypothetical protein